MAIALNLDGSIENGGGGAIVRPSLLPEMQRIADITSLDRVMVVDEGASVHSSIAAATEAVVIRDVTKVTHFILTGTGSADFKLAFAFDGDAAASTAAKLYNGFHFFIDNQSTRPIPVDGYEYTLCLLYTSPSPRDRQKSRMPSSA